MSTGSFLQRLLPPVAIFRPHSSPVKHHTTPQAIETTGQIMLWEIICPFKFSAFCFWHFNGEYLLPASCACFPPASVCVFQSCGVKAPLGHWWAADSTARDCGDPTPHMCYAQKTSREKEQAQSSEAWGNVSTSRYALCDEVSEPCCGRRCW